MEEQVNSNEQLRKKKKNRKAQRTCTKVFSSLSPKAEIDGIRDKH